MSIQSKSRRRAVIVSVSLFAAIMAAPSSVLAGDLKAAQRSLRSARTALETRRYEEVERRLAEAEKQLDGLEAAAIEDVVAEIASLREGAETGIRERKAYEIEKECGRNLDAARRELERNGAVPDGDPRVVEYVEGPLAKVEARLAKDDAQECLPGDVKERIEGEVASVRGQADEASRGIRVGRTEQWLAKIEAVNRGDDTEARNREMVERWIGFAEEELSQTPAHDERVPALQERVRAAKSGFESLVAAAGREEVITQAVELWKTLQDAYAGPSVGFESEQAPSYEDFLASGDLGADKTVARYDVVSRILDNETYLRALREFPDDERIARLVAEVEQMTEESAGRLCAMANELLDAADADDQSTADRITRALRSLDETVRIHTSGASAHEATTRRVRSTIQRIESAVAAASAEKEALEKELTDEVAKRWPSVVAAFEWTAGIDPVGAVEDISSVDGDVIRLENKSNRAGWDYDTEDYDYIAKINGVPVAGKLDAALRARIDAQAKETGIEFDPNDIEDVIAVVDGTCRVMQIEYSKVTRQYYNVISYKAPLLRIVAVRSGPFGLSLDDAGEASTGSGFGWLIWLALIGGGALVWKRRDDPRVAPVLARAEAAARQGAQVAIERSNALVAAARERRARRQESV